MARRVLPWSLLALAAGSVGCRAPAPPRELTPSASFVLQSRVLGEPRRINVYTPPGYDRAAAARYPVLYLLDGGVGEDFGHLTQALDAGIRAGAVRPFVAIGIENTERRRDLTGPTVVPRDQSIAPHVGGSAPFRAFLRDELRPAVSARLRVTDESAIVGESLAGLFVVETLLLEPSLFDTYIAVDPSLWWNDSALLRAADELLRTPPRVGRTLFLTAADERANAPFCAQFAAALQRAPAGLQWQFVPRPDLRHDTIFRAMAPVAFRAVLAKR